MPLFFFFTGILPVAGSEQAFLARLIPYIAISIIAFELLSRGTGYLFLSERFTMVRVWTYMLAALAVFTRKPLKFNVTPKGHFGVPVSAYAPQLALLVLSIAAPVWATIAFNRGWVNYSSSGWGAVAFWMNGLWALWNCYFALYVVRHTLAMRQQRDDHRFEEQLVVEVRVEGDRSGALVPAMTSNLNPAGLGFRATQRIEPGTTVSIHLPLGPNKVWTIGEVRHVKPEESHLGTVFMHGVAFHNLPIDVRDTIELYCTQHSMPMWRLRYRQSIDIVTRVNEVIHDLRGTRRRLVGLPANVTVRGAMPLDRTELPGRLILEEVSDEGARLLGDAPIAPGTSVAFDVPGATMSGAGTVRYVQTLRTSVSVMFSMGIELDTVSPPARRTWARLPWKSASRSNGNPNGRPAVLPADETGGSPVPEPAFRENGHE
jgi:hypothetical protein